MCPQAVGDRKTLKYERNRQVSPVPKNLHTIYIDKKITSKKIYRNPRVRITKNVGTVGTIAISIEFTRIERPQAVGDRK